MLSEPALRELIAGEESDRVEFTNSGKTEKWAEAVCAFANDFPNHRKPGYLLLGVENNGRVSGLTASDRTLLSLAALRSNVNLEPLPAMTVEKLSLPEGDVVVVAVHPSELPPVRYKGQVWIRVGPSRRAANRQEERMLVEKRASRRLSFDLQPAVGSALDDLVLDLFRVTYLPQAVSRDVIRENDRDAIEQLASLRFYDLAAECPTNAAVILFAKDPRRWIPGVYLQFVQWAGTTLADEPIDSRTVSGDLLTVLRDAESLASLPARSRPAPKSMLRESEEKDYPPVAIRELLMNAIMHRSYESNAPVRFYWYEDRIEIQSPGGLYGMASPENFPRQTDYRNPVVAEAMATLGYVNHFGRGVVRAREALQHNGNPEPEFEFDTHHVLVTVRRKP